MGRWAWVWVVPWGHGDGDPPREMDTMRMGSHHMRWAPWGWGIEDHPGDMG